MNIEIVKNLKISSCLPSISISYMFSVHNTLNKIISHEKNLCAIKETHSMSKLLLHTDVFSSVKQP